MSTFCVDSSIAIAAFGAWHEHHDVALAAIDRRTLVVAHAALETYSVLTRLPDPFRAAGGLVNEYLAATFPEQRLALPATEQRLLPERMAAAGVGGGAVYDGLVALTARAAGAVLLSFDRRAAATYVRLDAEHRVLI